MRARMRAGGREPREAAVLRAWAAHRAALDACQQAEIALEEIRHQAETAASCSAERAGFADQAGQAAGWSSAYLSGLFDSARVHAEHARLQAGRLAEAEQRVVELGQRVDACRAAYLRALARSHRAEARDGSGRQLAAGERCEP